MYVAFAVSVVPVFTWDERTWIRGQSLYLEHIVLGSILSFFDLTNLLPDSCIRRETAKMLDHCHIMHPH